MDIDRYITETGVTVTTGTLPAGWWGAYDHRDHKIILRKRLGATQRRSVLAHELGHAYFGHKGSTLVQEREASQWAARRLIDATEFLDAIRVCEYRTGVAQLLHVMPSDVDAYLSTLTEQEKMLVHHYGAMSSTC